MESDMANPKRGEATFFVGAEGDENRREYTLRFSINSLCTLEGRLGRPFTEVYEGWDKGNFSMRDFRETVRACLKGGKDLSPEDVGEIIEDAGIETVMDALTKAFERSALAKMGEEDEDPQKKGMERGIGMSSSTMPSPQG